MDNAILEKMKNEKRHKTNKRIAKLAKIKIKIMWVRKSSTRDHHGCHKMAAQTQRPNIKLIYYPNG